MSSIFDLMTAEQPVEEYNEAAEMVTGSSGGQSIRIAKWTIRRLYRVWIDAPMTPETWGLNPADARDEFEKGSFFFWNPVRKDEADAASKVATATKQFKRDYADEFLVYDARIENTYNGGDKAISKAVDVGAWPGANGKPPKKFWYNAGYQLLTLPSTVQEIALALGLLKDRVYNYANVLGAPPSGDAQLQFIGTQELPGELVVARAELWKALGGGDNYHKYTAKMMKNSTDGKIVPDVKCKTNVPSDTPLWGLIRGIVNGHKPLDVFAKVAPWVDPPTPDVIDSKGQARNVAVMLEVYKDEAAAIKAAGEDYVAPPSGKKIPQRFAAAGLAPADFQDFLNGIMKAMPAGAVAKDWIRTGPGLAVMKANDLGDALDTVAEWL